MVGLGQVPKNWVQRRPCSFWRSPAIAIIVVAVSVAGAVVAAGVSVAVGPTPDGIVGAVARCGAGSCSHLPGAHSVVAGAVARCAAGN